MVCTSCRAVLFCPFGRFWLWVHGVRVVKGGKEIVSRDQVREMAKGVCVLDLRKTEFLARCAAHEILVCGNVVGVVGAKESVQKMLKTVEKTVRGRS